MENQDVGLRAEGLVDFGIGDGAFAGDGPIVAIDANDGRGEGAAGIARVEYQREAFTKLLDDLRRVGAGRMTREIRAGAGDGSADGFD